MTVLGCWLGLWVSRESGSAAAQFVSVLEPSAPVITTEGLFFAELRYHTYRGPKS